jgi:hypothetical protein
LGDRWESVTRGIEWRLQRSAHFGQKIRNTELRICPVFLGGGEAYVAYYLIVDDDEVKLQSIVRHTTPLSPQFFDLEDD